MKKLFTLFVFLTTLVLLAYLWWTNNISAVNISDKKQVMFVIGKGQGIKEIANNLKTEGLIKNQVAFFLLVKQLGLDGKIQAGDFRLSPSMSAAQIAQNLTHGSLDVWITIPEGKRADEIADILKKDLTTYQTSWREELNKNEGYLFPDTYLIPKDTTIDQVISIMRNNFDTKFATLQKNNTKLTDEEIVILASMIEREAKDSQDRPLVASVLLNRLALGMKLDIDATIQYSLGYQENEKTWWKRGLTRSDLTLNSPYNTYTNPGLPPTPISNPGLPTLQAITNPAKTNYLFYISDSDGKNHYATSLEQHEANIRKYGL